MSSQILLDNFKQQQNHTYGTGPSPQAGVGTQNSQECRGGRLVYHRDLAAQTRPPLFPRSTHGNSSFHLDLVSLENERKEKLEMFL